MQVMPGRGQTLSRPTTENSHDTQIPHPGRCGSDRTGVCWFCCARLRPADGAGGSSSTCSPRSKRRRCADKSTCASYASQSVEACARPLVASGTRGNAAAQPGTIGEGPGRLAGPIRWCGTKREQSSSTGAFRSIERAAVERRRQNGAHEQHTATAAAAGQHTEEIEFDVP